MQSLCLILDTFFQLYCELVQVRVPLNEYETASAGTCTSTLSESEEVRTSSVANVASTE